MNRDILAGDLQFKKHVINDQTDYSAAALIDVDQDGRLDVVCGEHWYQAPAWKKHFVADVPRIRGRPDGYAHLAFDVNRDGFPDVITVNYRSRSIRWIEHPGRQLGPWTTHIAVEPGPMETGRLVDIDGDGQVDLLPNGARFAAWWEFRWKDKSSPGEPAWIRHDLPEEAGGHGLGFGDINGDGRGDIVAQHGWLAAPVDARNGTWKWHPDFTMERASVPMLVVDPDQDGDNDIVWCSAHGIGVYWFEQTQDEEGRRVWHRHAIDTGWSQGHAPLWVDMDGDGRNELVAGKRYMSHGGADPAAYNPLTVYRYQFNSNSRTWDRWTVAAAGEHVGFGLDPKAADIDGDGDLDLMASGRSGLYWLENLGPQASKAPSTVGQHTVDPDTRPIYDDHEDLVVVTRGDGTTNVVDDPSDWGLRRMHIVNALERAHGNLPGPSDRVTLDANVVEESVHDELTTQVIRYRVDAHRRADALLLIPPNVSAGQAAGVVCMFQPGSLDVEARVTELAQRGIVCIVPQLIKSGEPSAIRDAVWQTMRAADVLQACGPVHGERIGFRGDALQGELGLHVAAHDQRFVAVIADASGADSEIKSLDPDTYSMAEVIASAAPRGLNIVLPRDPNLPTSLEASANNASRIYRLRGAAENLLVSDPWSSAGDRENAYTWLQRKLER